MLPKKLKNHYRQTIDTLRKAHAEHGWTVLEVTARCYEILLNQENAPHWVPGFDVLQQPGEKQVVFKDLHQVGVIVRIVGRTKDGVRFADREVGDVNPEAFVAAALSQALSDGGLDDDAISITAFMQVLFVMVMESSTENNDSTYHLVDATLVNGAIQVTYQSEDGFEELDCIVYKSAMLADIKARLAAAKEPKT